MANEPYLNKALTTIEEVKKIGNYNGDIVLLVGDDLKDKVNYSNIIIKHFPTIDKSETLNKLNNKNISDGREFFKTFQYHKTYCFHKYFKSWDKCLFLDAGMKIIKPIKKIINLDCAGKLLAHSDAYPNYQWKLSCQFDKKYFPELYFDLEKQYDLNIDYFQSGIMLYDTNIIEEDTCQTLIDLSNKYYNTRTNEQAIFNLYFNCYKKIWEQIKIKDDETYYYDHNERSSFSWRDYIILKNKLTK